MAKIDLTDMAGGYQSATAYNANNVLIETAMENTLSRDGTTPNTMQADLDMNSYALNNVTTVNATAVLINGVAVDGTAPTSTTAALADVTDAVNTGASKVAGIMYFNTTTNKPTWSVGAADASLWVNADGTTAHTPV